LSDWIWSIVRYSRDENRLMEKKSRKYLEIFNEIIRWIFGVIKYWQRYWKRDFDVNGKLILNGKDEWINKDRKRELNLENIS
jgi:hypothetical protein